MYARQVDLQAAVLEHAAVKLDGLVVGSAVSAFAIVEEVEREAVREPGSREQLFRLGDIVVQVFSVWSEVLAGRVGPEAGPAGADNRGAGGAEFQTFGLESAR